MALTHAGVLSDSPGATGWAMALDKLAAHAAAHRAVVAVGGSIAGQLVVGVVLDQL